MLIPNLSVLLAERRLTLSKVSQDTRISRTTLTSLAGGAAKGIQFDTLNTLCQYLKVTPNDLFIYRPFDLSLSAEGLPGRSPVTFTLSRAGGVPERILLDCDADFIRGEAGILEALRLRLTAPEGDPRAAELVLLLEALPRPALSVLELALLRAFDRGVDPALAPDDYSPDIRWPWQ